MSELSRWLEISPRGAFVLSALAGCCLPHDEGSNFTASACKMQIGQRSSYEVYCGY